VPRPGGAARGRPLLAAGAATCAAAAATTPSPPVDARATRGAVSARRARAAAGAHAHAQTLARSRRLDTAPLPVQRSPGRARRGQGPQNRTVCWADSATQAQAIRFARAGAGGGSVCFSWTRRMGGALSSRVLVDPGAEGRQRLGDSEAPPAARRARAGPRKIMCVHPAPARTLPATARAAFPSPPPPRPPRAAHLAAGSAPRRAQTARASARGARRRGRARARSRARRLTATCSPRPPRPRSCTP
jgi:hypothetical protein